jgi:hypothetical protein
MQQGLTAESLSDNRLGRVLDSLFASGLNRLFRALVLKALEVYAIRIPCVHQDTTTIALHGSLCPSCRRQCLSSRPSSEACYMFIHLKHRRASMATWIRAA